MAISICFQDLVDDLRSNLRGDLENVVDALMVEPALYDAKELRKAMRVRSGPDVFARRIYHV